MFDKYLPLGSVVLLEGGDKRLLIYGRIQQEVETGRVWDYISCPFPEGHLNDNFTYLFDHDQIARVFFVGLQDEEELAFADAMLAAGAGQLGGGSPGLGTLSQP